MLKYKNSSKQWCTSSEAGWSSCQMAWAAWLHMNGVLPASPSLTHQLLLCGFQFGHPRSAQACELGLQHVDPLCVLLLPSKDLLLRTAALLVRSGLRGRQRTGIPGDVGGLTLSSKDECLIETTLLPDLLQPRCRRGPLACSGAGLWDWSWCVGNGQLWAPVLRHSPPSLSAALYG